jgi:hypothetical protein
MNNSLRARLRLRQDRDIRQGLERLGPLEQGELSDLIRDGFRLILKMKGVLPFADSFCEFTDVPPQNSSSLD